MALEGFKSFRMHNYTKTTLERFLGANTRELRAKKRNHYHASAAPTVFETAKSHTQITCKSRRARQKREAA